MTREQLSAAGYRFHRTYEHNDDAQRWRVWHKDDQQRYLNMGNVGLLYTEAHDLAIHDFTARRLQGLI